MNRLIFVIILLLIFGCQPTQTERKVAEQNIPISVEFDKSFLIGKDYLIDDQHSYLGFKIKYFGFSPVRGRFDSFDGTLFYDPDNRFISVTIIIDVSSINTGNERRDNDLTQTEEWFSAEEFPQIRFQSSGANFKKDGGFELLGELTIKGITKEIRVPFSPPTAISRDWAGNEQVDFSGRIIINRQDFGVKGDEFWSTVMENGLTQLSDEVEIEIDMHARRADYLQRYADFEADDKRKTVIDRVNEMGLENGLALIDSFQVTESKISSGNFSTIGYYFHKTGKFQIAETIFQKKLEFNPDSRATLNQLGISYLFLGKNEEAKTSFEKALKAADNDSRAIEYLRNY